MNFVALRPLKAAAISLGCLDLLQVCSFGLEIVTVPEALSLGLMKIGTWRRVDLLGTYLGSEWKNVNRNWANYLCDMDKMIANETDDALLNDLEAT